MEKIYKTYYFDGINQALFGKLKKKHRKVLIGMLVIAWVVGIAAKW